MRKDDRNGVVRSPSSVVRKVLSILLGAALWIGPAWPGEGKLTALEISRRMEAAQAKARDAQMRMKVEMKDALSGSRRKMEGEVKMKDPDLLYVHYTEPEEEFLYVKGGSAQHYQPSTKTVYRQEAQEGGVAAPIYLGIGRQLKHYLGISRVTVVRDNDREAGLLLVPKDPYEAGFDKMRVFVEKKDWWPVRLEVETPSTITKAQFSNFIFDQGLKDGSFEFTPPKGTQVVEGVVF